MSKRNQIPAEFVERARILVVGDNGFHLETFIAFVSEEHDLIGTGTMFKFGLLPETEPKWKSFWRDPHNEDDFITSEYSTLFTITLLGGRIEKPSD